jgi:hypothetical protein
MLSIEPAIIADAHNDAAATSPQRSQASVMRVLEFVGTRVG